MRSMEEIIARQKIEETLARYCNHLDSMTLGDLGQGFTDLVTLRYAIASLILALVIITYHLRNIEGRAFQAHVMRGYTLAFSVVCVTTLILQVLGKISAVPPTVGIGLVAILSFVSWRNAAKEPGQN